MTLHGRTEPLTRSPMSSPPIPVTQLLADLREGRRDAFDRLLAEVYDELQVLARAQLRNERADHTLNTTALVHEAYLKLVDQRQMDWQNRAHFFGTAARAMRRLLVDYARAKSRQKRKGEHVSLTQAHGAEGTHDASLEELIEIDTALSKLAELNERYARVVECRYFAGLTIQETAEALGVSHATVSEDWRFARAWLQRELGA